MLERLEETAGRAVRWGSRAEGGIAVLLSGLYFWHCAAQAARKPLWSDELFTLYLSRFHTLGGLLETLRLAADQQPPLFYLAARAATAAWGDPQMGMRVPSALGVWAACAAIYLLLRRRFEPAPALCGALLPLTGQGLAFAVEARPYGMVLGVYGVLLLCWQAAAENRGRRLALPLAAVCVFLLGSLHYLAVFALAPLFIAEVFRRWKQGRWDKPLVLALALGAAPLAIYLPLLLDIRGFATVFWGRTTMLQTVLTAHRHLSAPLTLAVLIPLLVAALTARRRAAEEQTAALQPHEAVLAGALALMAFAVPPLILKLTGGFAYRYFAALLMGWALLAGGVAGRFTSRRPLAQAGLLAIFLGTAASAAYLQSGPSAEGNPHFTPAISEMLARRTTPERAVFDSPLTYLEFWHHAPPGVKQRAVYAASPAAALRYAGADSTEQSLIRLSYTVPLKLIPPGELRAGESFLLVRTNRLSWLPAALSETGARMEILEEGGGVQLLLVTPVSPLRGEVGQ